MTDDAAQPYRPGPTEPEPTPPAATRSAVPESSGPGGPGWRPAGMADLAGRAGRREAGRADPSGAPASPPGTVWSGLGRVVTWPASVLPSAGPPTPTPCSGGCCWRSWASSAASASWSTSRLVDHSWRGRHRLAHRIHAGPRAFQHVPGHGDHPRRGGRGGLRLRRNRRLPRGTARRGHPGRRRAAAEPSAARSPAPVGRTRCRRARQSSTAPWSGASGRLSSSDRLSGVPGIRSDGHRHTARLPPPRLDVRRFLATVGARRTG